MHVKRSLRFAHSVVSYRHTPIFCVPLPFGVWLTTGQDVMFQWCQGKFAIPVNPVTGSVRVTDPLRCRGPRGVSTGSFQRTIVRYMECVMTDRGLYPVLRTRPDHIPPQICLPSTFRYGAYLYPGSSPGQATPTLLPPASSRRTLLQHPCLRLSFPSVRVDLDFAWHLWHSARHHHLAAGPSPAHNKRFQPTQNPRG